MDVGVVAAVRHRENAHGIGAEKDVGLQDGRGRANGDDAPVDQHDAVEGVPQMPQQSGVSSPAIKQKLHQITEQYGVESGHEH